MARACGICSNPNRNDIEKELAKGTSYRNISEQYGVSISSLSGHVNHGHIQVRAPFESRGKSMFEIAREMLDRAIGIVEATENDGQLRTALAAMREVREYILLLDKMSADSVEDKPITEHPAWPALEVAIVEALADSPGALDRFMEAVEDASGG